MGHTKGEWSVHGPKIYGPVDGRRQHICTVEQLPCIGGNDDLAAERAWEMEKDNARLIVAAVNSYDQYCGSRAVECAEGDLLGEALEVCRQVGHILGDLTTKEFSEGGDRGLRELAKAVLSKLQPKGGR